MEIPASNVFHFGPFRVDLTARQVWRGGDPLRLTGKQFDVLRTLVRHAPEFVDKETIYKEAWDEDETVSYKDAVKTHVAALRRVFGVEYIGSARVKGYRIAVPVVQDQAPVVEPSSVSDPSSVVDPSSVAEPTRQAPARIRFRVIAAAVLFSLSASSNLGLRSAPVPGMAFGRLLAGATSEGGSLRRIPLRYSADHVVAGPANQIFMTANAGRVLSILNTADQSIHTVDLPEESDRIAVAPDGTVYVASRIDGVMAIDPVSRKVTDVIRTGGPVSDIAVSHRGDRLYFAMETLGLWKLSIPDRKLLRISDRVCPVNVQTNHSGDRLYVSYQCGGPGGRAGHDSIEVFDTRTEKSLGIVTGSPMVGSPVAISPDDELLAIDGGDACENPGYDRTGCPAQPGMVIYLLRTLDLRLLKTFFFPPGAGGVIFLDNSRLLIGGEPLRVVDAAHYTVTEQLDIEDALVFSAPGGSPIWLTQLSPPALLEFERPGACRAPAPRPAMFYPADGSFSDVEGFNSPDVRGKVQFQPGRVGQAFFFNGDGYLSIPWTGTYQLNEHDFSISAQIRFLKVEADAKEAKENDPIIDWTDHDPLHGVSLWREPDGRFAFRYLPGATLLKSRTIATPGSWYNAAVTMNLHTLALYVNGILEDSVTAPPRMKTHIHAPLLIGAGQPAQPKFRGWIDELAFFNRGLDGGEVQQIARQIAKEASGLCDPSARP